MPSPLRLDGQHSGTSRREGYVTCSSTEHGAWIFPAGSSRQKRAQAKSHQRSQLTLLGSTVFAESIWSGLASVVITSQPSNSNSAAIFSSSKCQFSRPSLTSHFTNLPILYFCKMRPPSRADLLARDFAFRASDLVEGFAGHVQQALSRRRLSLSGQRIAA